MNTILHSSIFRRFILLFLCVVIPIMCVTLLLANRAERTARVEMSQGMAEKADYYILGMEAEHARVISQHENLILDYDLISLSYRDSSINRFSWITSINRLQEKLQMFKDTNAYVHVISVYMLPTVRVVSSQGGGRFTYDYISVDGSERLDTLVGKSGRTYITDGQLAIYTGNRRGDTTYFIIETLFSSDSLLGGYKQFVDGVGCFLYNDEGIIVQPEDAETASLLAGMVSREPGEEHIVIQGRRYLVIKRQLSMAGLCFISYCDEDGITASANVYRFWLWATVALFFVLTCLYAFMTHIYLSRPVMALLKHFERLEGGDMNLHIESKRHDEFGILFDRFNRMVERLNSFILQSYKQTIYLQRAELKQLQAQINPHFLYNSYFLLHRLIKAQNPYAVEYSRFLGEYYKYITKSAGNAVALEREDAHARNYASIQALRFENRIRIEFDSLPEEMKGLCVPALILQPILENAFLHGLEDLDGDGQLKVSYAISKSAYHIHVSNNGGPIGEEALSDLTAAFAVSATGEADVTGTTGLANIHRRLQLAFGPCSGLSVSSRETVAIVEMTIDKEEARAKTADC